MTKEQLQAIIKNDIKKENLGHVGLHQARGLFMDTDAILAGLLIVSWDTLR